MSTNEIRCPWCSALLPDAAADKCPSCGAQLSSSSGNEPNLPGVTALDPEAIARARSDAGRSRGGILSFLTRRDLPAVDAADTVESLSPPDNAVRREMLRLELEAEQADAVAESVALKSDVLAEKGIHLDQLNAIEEQAEAAYESEAEGRTIEPPPAGSQLGPDAESSAAHAPAAEAEAAPASDKDAAPAQ